ncbi:MAG: TIGR04255 family protein [Terracidiphilus sp.]
MARGRAHLRNAPIVEALIDFRVLRKEEISAEAFANIGASIGAQYMKESSIQSIQARFGVDKGKMLETIQSHTEIGWRYRTATEVAQFRIDGFTFSKLAKYTTWEEISEEAFRLWKVYVNAAEPREVFRVAVRYINRMRLPSAPDLGEYLEAPPQLPLPIPQTIRDFLCRVSVRDEKRNASAVILQALEPRLDPNAITLLLDIDAFRDVTLAPDDPALLAIFGELRELKNEIFFASIAEKTVEIYA